MYIPFGKLFHIFQRPGQPRRRLLQAGQRRRRRRPSAAAAARPFASAQQMADLQGGAPAGRASTTTHRRWRQLPGHLPALPPAPGDAGPVGARSEGSADGPPADHRGGAGRPLRPAPQPGAARRLGRRASRSTGSSRPTAASAASSAASSSRSRTTRSSASSPGTSSRSTRASSAPRASSATCRAATPTGCCTRWSATRPRRAGSARSAGTQALDRVGRRDPAHPGRRYGDDAFAMLSGVSLTNEKSYLIGKFARLALHTANLDYNGRLCMVSAGAGNKKALGIDRAPNPWSDIPLADVVLVAGVEHRRDVPDHHELHLAGPRPRRQAHRRRPAGRARWPAPPTCSCRCGRAPTRRCSAPCCTCSSSDDWLDHDFIDAHTVGFDEAAAAVADMTPQWAADITGVPAARIEQAAEWWGTVGDRDAAARPRHRAPDQGRRERARPPSTSGSPPASSASPGCGVTTITGQGNGQGGREHGHKCDQLPGNRDITNPEHRAARRVGVGLRRVRDPRQGPHRPGDHRGHPRAARSRGCCRSASTRPCRCPTPASPRRRSTSSSSTPSSTSSCPRPAHHADVVLPGSLHEEDEGTSTSGEGRVIKINAGRRRRPARPGCDWQILVDLAERLGQGRVLPVRRHRGDLRGAAPGLGGRHRRLPRASPGSGSRPSSGCSGPSPRSATPARRGCSRAAASTTPTARPASTRCRSGSRPRWSTTTTRCGSPPAGSSASTCRAPRPAASAALVDQYPEPLCEMHPRLAEQPRHRRRRPRHRHVPPRDDDPAGARRGTRSGPTPCSSPTTGPGAKAANQLTNRALDPIRRCPSSRSPPSGSTRAGGPRARPPTPATSTSHEEPT